MSSSVWKDYTEGASPFCGKEKFNFAKSGLKGGRGRISQCQVFTVV